MIEEADKVPASLSECCWGRRDRPTHGRGDCRQAWLSTEVRSADNAAAEKAPHRGRVGHSRASPTWLVLGWPLVVTIAAAALAVLVVVSFPTAPVGVGYVLLALVLVAAGWLGIRALQWHTTSIVLTTSRILERRGVFTRHRRRDTARQGERALLSTDFDRTNSPHRLARIGGRR